MSYQALARKYRPQKFSDVIGQDHVTRTLQNAIAQDRIAHGYIFSGHRGIGKTTIARILAMALNCRKADRPGAEPCGECESCAEVRAGNAVDVIEIDAATNRGIDEIRELREAARYRPARDRFKIYILDEAHQITDAAFNALLKTLEEPPSHIVFMMATTQPEDIPQTIRSRCQHFSFHAVKFDDIVGQLNDIARQEGIEASDDAIAVLAEAGDGSMRDALSIMDQAIACCGATLTPELVRGLVGSVSTEVLEGLMGAVARDSSEDALHIVDQLVMEGQSPAHFVKQLVRFLRNALVAKVSGDQSKLLQISSDERKRVARVAGSFSEEDLARFLQITLRTHDDIGYKSEQRFHLELGILKMVHAQRLLPIEQLLSEQPLSAHALSANASGVQRAPVTPRAIPAAPPAKGEQASASNRPEPATAGDRPAPAAPPADTAASPFEADRARKSRGPEMGAGASFASGSAAAAGVAAESKHTSPAIAATAVALAAIAARVEQPEAVSTSTESPAEKSPAANESAKAANIPTNDASANNISTDAVADSGVKDLQPEVAELRTTILEALERAGHNAVSIMLEEGSWSLAGNELQVTVARSAVMIDMSFGAEPKRCAVAAASSVAGRPLKIKLISEAASSKPAVAPQHRGTSRPGGARTRAAEEPIVQYMQQKFGGEIRTVIDYKDKV